MGKLRALASLLPPPPPPLSEGRVLAVQNGLIHTHLPLASPGQLCTVATFNQREILAQVVSFFDDVSILAPFESPFGITRASRVKNSGKSPKIRIPLDPRGSIIDPFGTPLITTDKAIPQLELEVFAPPPSPLARTPITQALPTGIRSIDALCTLGRGQRVGLFAGAGVGKSTLLGMITKNAVVDVVVIALVGERGREVKDFIEEALGEEGRARAVVVVATSEESAMKRALAPHSATTIAEYYREQGLNVLLVVDSLTRMARALREVGLAAGELPVRGGFTPSVYAELPKLLERAGTNEKGSITGVYTTLLAAEGESDPLGEEVKSILDGHLYLSSDMVQRSVRPAIDPSLSISRLFSKVTSLPHQEAQRELLSLFGRIKRDKELIMLGGAPDPELTRALQLEEKILKFLSQRREESIAYDQTIKELIDIFKN